MESLLKSIPNVMDSLPTQFTSHQLIIVLAQSSQHAYIEALYENLGSDRPFQALHSKIGKHLGKITSIRLVSKEKDANIFGQVSENARWEKIA